jgi:hypothetical protein
VRITLRVEVEENQRFARLAHTTALAMASTEQAAVPGGSSSRIPVALQMIFLHSNRGFNVDKPPPAKVASKIFPRALALTKSRTSSFDSTEPRVAATSERSSDTAAIQEDFDGEDSSCSEESSDDAGNDFSEVMDVESVAPKQVEMKEESSEVTEGDWVPPNQSNREEQPVQPWNFCYEIERVRLTV